MTDWPSVALAGSAVETPPPTVALCARRVHDPHETGAVERAVGTLCSCGRRVQCAPAGHERERNLNGTGKVVGACTRVLDEPPVVTYLLTRNTGDEWTDRRRAPGTRARTRASQTGSPRRAAAQRSGTVRRPGAAGTHPRHPRAKWDLPEWWRRRAGVAVNASGAAGYGEYGCAASPGSHRMRRVRPTTLLRTAIAPLQ